MAYTLHKDEDGILQVTFSGSLTEEELKAYIADLANVLDEVPEDEKTTLFH